jgi:hypothetical protein
MIEPKEKHIHKNKHDNIHIYISNMFVIVELPYGTWGRRERKRERQSVIWKCITSVQVEDIMICTESC